MNVERPRHVASAENSAGYVPRPRAWVRGILASGLPASEVRRRPLGMGGRLPPTLSRHDPTTPDATPLSPDARRDTTNVRPRVRAMPSVRSFIISQIWNLQRLVSPRQPRLYLVLPPIGNLNIATISHLASL
jgi:hypothetical protein